MSCLVIQGNPTQYELQNAYNDILLDYYDCAGAESNKKYLFLLKQSEKMQVKIKLLCIWMDYYFITRGEDIKKLISKYGFHFEEGISDTFLIKQFDGYIKYLMIDLDSKQKDLDSMLNKSAGEVATKKTFLINIIYMAKENYKVDYETSTLQNYSLIYNLYNDFITQKIASLDAKY